MSGLQNGWGRGRRVQPAAPYHIANEKRATPRPGATAVSHDLSGRMASAAPRPVDSDAGAAARADGPGTRSTATIALVMSTSSSKSVSLAPMTL